MLSVLRTLFDHFPPLLYGLSHSPWLYRLIFPSYGPGIEIPDTTAPVYSPRPDLAVWPVRFWPYHFLNLGLPRNLKKNGDIKIRYTLEHVWKWQASRLVLHPRVSLICPIFHQRHTNQPTSNFQRELLVKQR